MPRLASRHREFLTALWPWLPLWLLVALGAIFQHGPMPLFSTRTLAVAWDMFAHGHWLVPHLNGAPYSDKTPLLYWFIHAGWFVFGVNDIWPRLLQVAFGAAELVLITQLARRLFPERPWVARATPWLLMALGYAFLFNLQIMYDVLLAVWTLAALLCLTPKPGRSEPRWWLFGLCIGLGLLTKGPVMLLHVAFPWLLGPLWSAHARGHWRRWYGRGIGAVVLGLLILAAWVVPAVIVGSETYRHELLFAQTVARVSEAVSQGASLQTHAHAWWWYLAYLPILLFPLFFWPRAWAALIALRRPLATGVSFCLCWLLPVLVVLSSISGKQPYYPLPEFGGVMLLLAGAIAVLRERHPTAASTGWLGAWPLAVCSLALALLMVLLPVIVEHSNSDNAWLAATARYSPYTGIVFALLSLLLVWRGRSEVLRLSLAGLVGALTVNTLFTLAVWPRYNLQPTAQLFSRAQANGHALAHAGDYNGEFNFAGRLTEPVRPVYDNADIAEFAQGHPRGLLTTTTTTITPTDRRYALLIQPFRTDWLITWRARTYSELQAGHTPDEPDQPARIIDPTQRRGYSGVP